MKRYLINFIISLKRYASATTAVIVLGSARILYYSGRTNDDMMRALQKVDLLAEGFPYATSFRSLK